MKEHSTIIIVSFGGGGGLVCLQPNQCATLYNMFSHKVGPESNVFVFSVNCSPGSASFSFQGLFALWASQCSTLSNTCMQSQSRLSLYTDTTSTLTPPVHWHHQCTNATSTLTPPVLWCHQYNHATSTPTPSVHKRHQYTDTTNTLKPSVHWHHQHTDTTNTLTTPLHWHHQYTSATSTLIPPVHRCHQYTDTTSTLTPPVHWHHLHIDALPQLSWQLFGVLWVGHVDSCDEALWFQCPLGHQHFPEVLVSQSSKTILNYRTLFNHRHANTEVLHTCKY